MTEKFSPGSAPSPGSALSQFSPGSAPSPGSALSQFSPGSAPSPGSALSQFSRPLAGPTPPYSRQGRPYYDQ